MKLFLMRHAEAESGMQMDPTRKLTPTGKDQARMMGKWLARQVEKPEIILQSNFHRARSTAQRVGKQLGLAPMICPQLDPENEPEIAWKAIKDIGKDKGVQSVIAITHGPLVEKMLAYLTGSNLPNQFHFAHATIAMFETVGGVTEEQKQKRSLKLRESVDSGDTEKSWVGGTCEVCQDNSDAGWIDMDDTFPSGDDEPPAHPNCDCDLETRDALQESAVPLPRRGILHWMVTPNVVARDEDELDMVTSEAFAAVDAALRLAEVATLIEGEW